MARLQNMSGCQDQGEWVNRRQESASWIGVSTGRGHFENWAPQLPIRYFRNYPVWAQLGVQDIVVRYRRSTLGPFWITLATAAFVFGIGTVYSIVLKQPASQYLHFLASGLVFWQFLSGCATDGSGAFIAERGLLLNTRIQPIEIVLRCLFRNLLILAHSLPVVVVTWIIAYPDVGLHLPALVAGLAVFLANCFWIALFLAVVSARYRDIPSMLTSVLQLVFILSPIIWSPDLLPERSFFVDLNPVAHLIECVRAPIVDGTFDLLAFTISLALAIVGNLVAIALYRSKRGRLAYWA